MEGILYEAVFDPNKVKGVFGISLVENPATKETFIQLSEDEKLIQFKTVDEEQRLLIGLALQPDVPVYRNDNGEEFHIVFRSDTIKEVAHNFFKEDYHKNSTIEHDGEKIEGITFVESWIVSDSKRDKSNVYGMEYPVGSWLVAMKVDSDEIWNDYVKTGKVQGFSIDALMTLKKVNNKVEFSMKLLEKLKEASEKVALAFNARTPDPDPVEIKMGEVMMEGGEVVFEFEGEVLEAGVNIFAVDKTDPENKIPVPIGEYPLETGEILVVSEEGLVGEIKSAEEPTPTEEEPTPTEEEPVQQLDQEAIVNSIKSILIKYMDDKLGEFKTELTSLKEEVVELSEQPTEKPRKTPAPVALNSSGRLLQTIRNANN